MSVEDTETTGEYRSYETVVLPLQPHAHQLLSLQEGSADNGKPPASGGMSEQAGGGTSDIVSSGPRRPATRQEGSGRGAASVPPAARAATRGVQAAAKPAQPRGGAAASPAVAWQAGHAAWQVGWSLQCIKLCWRLTSLLTCYLHCSACVTITMSFAIVRVTPAALRRVTC